MCWSFVIDAHPQNYWLSLQWEHPICHQHIKYSEYASGRFSDGVCLWGWVGKMQEAGTSCLLPYRDCLKSTRGAGSLLLPFDTIWNKEYCCAHPKASLSHSQLGQSVLGSCTVATFTVRPLSLSTLSWFYVTLMSVSLSYQPDPQA